MEIVLHDPSARGSAGSPGSSGRCSTPIRGAHTVTLTVLDGLVRRGDSAAVLVSLHQDGVVIGATVRTAGRPLHISGLPADHVAAVEAVLATEDPDLPGVAGSTASAEAFAAAHVARTGDTAGVDIVLRLFALGVLAPPTDVPGTARRAGMADVGLLGAWRAALAEEENRPRPDASTPAGSVAAVIVGGGGEMIWEVDGVTVSQASSSPMVAGMSRIGPVYTPAGHRRRGYAAAVTAAARCTHASGSSRCTTPWS